MGKFIDMTGWVMAEHGVPDSRLTVIEQTSAPLHINNKKRKHTGYVSVLAVMINHLYIEEILYEMVLS